ncbi:MAG: hypothetical protein RIQ78_356 [Bacteroidota bacterium]
MNIHSRSSVLCIMTIYNEIEYLPYKLKFCQENNLDLYIIDNISDDGSWEWLQENKVPSHRFDTDGAFSLGILQEEIVRTIHTIKPDWVIYNGCDLFILTEKNLYDEIMEADKNGFNIIKMDVLNMFNTGEQHQKNPFETYFYYKLIQPNIKLIHKYQDSIRYVADAVILPDENILQVEGCMVNYGSTKSKEKRNITLERRKKAWDLGEPLAHGTHYLVGNNQDWIWEKADLLDIRASKYNTMIHKLIDLMQ